MADETVVHIGENSPEHVAYRLLRDVALAEEMAVSTTAKIIAERKWILDTYTECLRAVKGNREGDSNIRLNLHPHSKDDG